MNAVSDQTACYTITRPALRRGMRHERPGVRARGCIYCSSADLAAYIAKPRRSLRRG